ncbi:hypothetical protein ACVIW2_000084 [Bradyrhizobium huanghuaihaiense]|uniref:DUF4238 domain-containing protein n=1 Tax=Bradyrhizobium barranii subsp. barranii TaxID=2823807 RepID=A0A7Z0TSI1_9BRAD|nr:MULTISPECIES: DUF4238 domain-containing protein [Bradyrhizobium]MBR0868668.1 DUF4238 domain-containing protein [Bradyrhizobium diazoefficiens]MBR0893237.1 DUF4238 domain-containing protein [Bradyrhizobium diazoefficiens]MBR0924925.1 DUF4238 domain-containing protein [Bradyrhizobium diazoefficiens]UGX89555.1 DUF4238 domain-containing protein [Bradyrhizobium barranii subsp. barranii]UQE03316.1 DUF4238 domain-containing protein [Bradyrhizobium japonicum]
MSPILGDTVLSAEHEMGGRSIMAKEANAKIQHYVPQYYLRGFVNEKRQLYVVDRPRKKFFRVPTNKVGGEQHFNLVTIPGINPFGMEEALSDLESKVAPVLEQVKGRHSLGDENDRNAILNLVAAVTLRNPKQREAIGEMYNEVAQAQFAQGLATKEGYEPFLATMKAEGRQALPYEEMREMFAKQPELFKVTPSHNFHIMVEASLHEHLVQLYEGRRWQVIVAGEDTGGFVTSDHPVCLRWADVEDHGDLSPGFAVPGTEVIFPLSPRLALRGRFDGEENLVQLSKDEVATINSLLISNAHNQVYARDALFSYMRAPGTPIASGATLDQDETFLTGGKSNKEVKIIGLRSK